MFYKQSKPDVYTNLDYSIASLHHRTHILSFLQSNLKIVINKLTGASKLNLTTMQEDDITRELVNLLNDKLCEQSGYIFRFEAKSGPDMLIFASPYEPGSLELFVIEAKRLPPTSSQDYVKTGIGRFKRELHGEQHDIAAMLGYIQEEDFGHWHGKINGWIDSLINNGSDNDSIRWKKEDHLAKVNVSDIGEYRSKHSRITQGPIDMYHFWINLCSRN